MSALEDSIRMKPLAKWLGPSTADEIVRMLSFTPALGKTDKDRVRRWLDEPGSKYLPDPLRAELERMYP